MLVAVFIILRPTFEPEKCDAISSMQDENDNKGKLWGWKGPRAIYFLPFYQAIFGDNFRFLHVLRDGRDVSFGDNQMQFWMLCNKFYGAGSGMCELGQDKDHSHHHCASLSFWGDVNRQAYELATTVLDLDRDGGRYMVLRVEDLAIPQVFTCLQDLCLLVLLRTQTVELVSLYRKKHPKCGICFFL